MVLILTLTIFILLFLSLKATANFWLNQFVFLVFASLIVHTLAIIFNLSVVLIFMINLFSVGFLIMMFVCLIMFRDNVFPGVDKKNIIVASAVAIIVSCVRHVLVDAESFLESNILVRLKNLVSGISFAEIHGSFMKEYLSVNIFLVILMSVALLFCLNNMSGVDK